MEGFEEPELEWLTPELIYELHYERGIPLDSLYEFREMGFQYNRKNNTFSEDWKNNEDELLPDYGDPV